MLQILCIQIKSYLIILSYEISELSIRQCCYYIPELAIRGDSIRQNTKYSLWPPWSKKSPCDSQTLSGGIQTRHLYYAGLRYDSEHKEALLSKTVSLNRIHVQSNIMNINTTQVNEIKKLDKDMGKHECRKCFATKAFCSLDTLKK
jgi:hypothetical protein